MLTRKIECQNEECRFRVSGKEKKKDRRKRIMTVYLEGNSYIVCECPVCHQRIEVKPEEENKGLTVFGDVKKLAEAINLLDKYVFEDEPVKEFLRSANVSCEIWTTNPKKCVDNRAEDVLRRLVGKNRDDAV